MSLSHRLKGLERDATRRVRETPPPVRKLTQEGHRVLAELARPGRGEPGGWVGPFADLANCSDQELMRRLDAETVRPAPAAKERS